MKYSYIITALFIFVAYNINAQTLGSYKDKRDGITYKTIKVGDQIWMAENLAYKYSYGCRAYNYDNSNIEKYGYLYDYAVADKVCPDGWHLPSKKELETLLENYGGDKDHNENYNTFLKEGNLGFTAVMGGFLDGDESGEVFLSLGEMGYYWSSSKDQYGLIWCLGITKHNKESKLIELGDNACYSIRCIQD